MRRLFILPLILAACAIASPAAAQLSTIVVPSGGGVVIGPRGEAFPRPTLAPAPVRRRQPRVVAVAPSGETLSAPGAAAAIGLAAAAGVAVLLGGGGSSSGSGGSSGPTATVRTR